MGVKFEKVSAYKDIDFNLPQRKTKYSAGYDFEVPEDVVIPSIFKNLLKIIEGRMSSTDFLLDFHESDIFKKIDAELRAKGGAENLSEDEQIGIYQQFLIPFAQHIFYGEPITLEEMKEITKSMDARATLIPTGVKAKLQPNQKLELLIRSSTPLNSYIIMGNSIGLIDADYYNNPDNEGHIFFQVINLSPFDIKLNKGDVIGQGVISEYQIVDNDNAEGERAGGFGSTDKQ